MLQNEVETDNTQNEVETENTPGEVMPEEETPKEAEPTLTKEQKSKLDSFDRIYAENKSLKDEIAKSTPKKEISESVENKEVWGTSSDPLEVARLGKAINNYSEEEIEGVIMPMAKGKYSTNVEGILKAVKDPMVQAAILQTRVKAEEKSKIPEPSSPGELDKISNAQEIAQKGRDAVIADVAKRAAQLEKRERGEGI